MNSIIIIIFQLVVLLFSVILHEISHGYMAYLLGDNTAKDSGRLTLNPLSHLDPMGSFIFPLLMFFLTQGSFVVGWAKPVPFNPNNLRKPKRDIGLVGIAGPLINLVIALIFSLLLRFINFFNFTLTPINEFFGIIIYLNILLAVFNLVPIPPLDGSRVLYSFLPQKWEKHYWMLERYGMILIMLFAFFGFQLLIPIIESLFSFLVG